MNKMKSKSQHNKILKEGVGVLEAMRHAKDEDGLPLDVCMMEIYLTDVDGQVLELEIGIDEDGKVEKTFGTFEDEDAVIEVELEETYTGLLN
jgi:hypothetical protein